MFPAVSMTPVRESDRSATGASLCYAHFDVDPGLYLSTQV